MSKKIRNLFKFKNNKGSYILLICPATAFGLGIWQVTRRNWKLELIENIDKRTNADPIVIETHKQLDNEYPEYTLVKLKGIFDNDREVFVGPRMLIQDSVPKRFTKNMPWPIGYNLITPMKLICNSQTVLINRGWVPKEKLYSETRERTQLDGVVEIQALVRTTNEEQSMVGVKSNSKKFKNLSDPNIVVFNQKNREEIAKLLGTSHWLADQTFDEKVAEFGGPLGGQTRVILRNEHLQYIFTWFALGIATTFIWVKSFRF